MTPLCHSEADEAPRFCHVTVTVCLAMTYDTCRRGGISAPLPCCPAAPLIRASLTVVCSPRFERCHRDLSRGSAEIRG